LLPIPPLQKFDIPLLAKHFLGKSLRKEVLEEMMTRDYPGNVRDLERYCQQLWAERGKTIFARKDSTAPGTGSLDYNRFKEEIETWDINIQPIVDKYKLNFRYKYLPPFTSGGKIFPLPPRSIFELVWGNVKNASYDDLEALDREEVNKIFRKMATNSNWILGLYKLVEFLNCGIEANKDGTIKYLPHFIDRFSELLELKGGLPYLLRVLRKPSVSQKELQDLSHLLNKGWDEAKAQFQLIYFENCLTESEGDMNAAAQKAGLNKNTFRTNLRRARRNSANHQK